MNLRETMQLDGLAGPYTPGSMDERFWPIEANAFATGDVDGDGDLDVLVAENNGSNRIWLNDGAGGFTGFVALPTFLGCAACALFDADGDGDLDALLGGGRTTYPVATLSALFRNDGGGTFTSSPTIPNDWMTDRLIVRDVCVGDLDQDGDLDVVMVAETGPRYWRNDGACMFSDGTTLAWPGGVTSYWSSVRAMLVDVEPDGDLDLVTQNPDQLYRNNGQGVFTTQPAIPWVFPDALAIAVDVDGDQLVDEVGMASNLPFVRRNLGGGVFQNVSATWFEPHARIDHTYNPSYTHCACAVFDADGDGRPDLITGGTEGRNTASTTVGIPPKLFLNAAGQRFVDGCRSPLPMLQSTAASAVAGDIDGDGDTDLVLGFDGWGSPQSANIWKQDSGRFVPSPGWPAWGWMPIGSLALADVDGDGDLDLIGARGSLYFGGGGQHVLAMNDGTGTFTDVTATHMPPVASLGQSVVIGDVDDDGDIDVVIGSAPYGGAPLILLRNDGTGVFTDASAQLPPTFCYGTRIALRDLDGDGDLDIAAPAAGPYGSPQVVLFFNDNAGVFTDVTSGRIPGTTFSSTRTGLSAVDLDGDGDVDIAFSGVRYINNGSGTFTATAGPDALAVAVDLDEDGAPDSIVTAGDVLVSGGPTVFSGYNISEYSVVPADLDEDGDLDLVVCPHGPYDDWRMARTDVVYNLRRDLRAATLPRLGHPYRLQLRATNGNAALPATFAIVAFATATLPQAVEIPGWGKLRIDPAQMAVLGTALIPDADTMVELSMPIPSAPSLFGLPLSCQALFVPIGNEAATHLSNAMTFPLER